MYHRGPDDEGISDFEFRISDLKGEELRAKREEQGISDFEELHHRDTENTEDAQRRNSKSEIRNSTFADRNPKFAGAGSIGMRRLSIIDIEGGHQPVFNEDGQIGAVLNGEIYNFQELRQQLEDRGHTIRTRSDSEVAVHAYEEWGKQCVEHFEGMFALAIFDQKSEARGQRSESREARSSEFRVPSSGLSAGEGRRETRSFEFRVPRSETQHSALSTQDSPVGPALSTLHSALEPALNNQHSATLFLARDRLGIKPLYYFAEGEVQSPKSKVQSQSGSEGRWTLDIGHWTRFLFASEVRTLLASGIVPRRLSKAAVESYLLFGSVSEPMTLIEGVFSLPPGHRMTIDLNDANAAIRSESYWNIAGARRGDAETGRRGETGTGRQARSNGHRSNHSDVANAAQRTRQLLTDSVRKHLIADVPVGVFLSSGIDSTALAVLASREAAGVHTFTVAFPEKEFSEADIARHTAATLGTTHQELMLSGDEMLARLTEAVGALDQPSMDGINTYFVSWGARQAGLKVTLSGLGGDEVFGGYNTFRRTANFQRLATIGANMPQALRTAVASAVTGAGGRFVSGDVARKLTAILSSSESLPDAFYFGRTLFTPAQVAALLVDNKPNGALSPWRAWLAETALQANELDAFAAVTCMEARSYLVNTLLRDTDSMSMAHSLEVRVPFLDHPLVEFVTGLPQAAKLRKGMPKALLVEALRDLLPSDVVGQKKRGFTFPWAEWLRGPLKARVETGLSELSPALREVLDAKATRRVWQDYLDGKTSWSRPWSLYVLNEWAKKHLE
ncbi:MAG: hypothetical protein QOF62_364 [Pyrinomonadaceae bacterium]|nr:hypothetical protein [Pyrinomonadaceae bacterium]